MTTVVLYMHLPSGAVLTLDRRREIRVEGDLYPTGRVIQSDKELLASDLEHIGAEFSARAAGLNAVLDGAIATCQRRREAT